MLVSRCLAIVTDGHVIFGILFFFFSFVRFVMLLNSGIFMPMLVVAMFYR